jgi:poly(A) polymerase
MTMEFNELFKVVRAALPPDRTVYLVGGAVRDIILKRPIHDLDFVLGQDTTKVARSVARKLRAPFFMLDEKRLAARVIFRPTDEEEYLLDFALMVGSDLETDLRSRDFTINAMAVRVTQPEIIIDPLGGEIDTRGLKLRTCSPTSIIDDPLRILRGIRLAIDLNLSVSLEAETLMRDGTSLLGRVSAERIRDEIIRMMVGPDPLEAVQWMDRLDVLKYLFPEILALKNARQTDPHVQAVWEHTLQTLRYLKELLDVLDKRSDTPEDPRFRSFADYISRYKENIKTHLSETIISGRPLRSLLFLAALLHDNAKPLTISVDSAGRIHNYGHDRKGAEVAYTRARTLVLSNSETDYIHTIIRHHMRIHSAVHSRNIMEGKMIYRFFRDTGKAGIDIGLLSLADTLATYENTLPDALWQKELENCAAIFEAWWNKPSESVRPSQLLNGDELMTLFGLKPGKYIGRLLADLQEAQAAKEITNRQEALDYIRKKLNYYDPDAENEKRRVTDENPYKPN